MRKLGSGTSPDTPAAHQHRCLLALQIHRERVGVLTCYTWGGVSPPSPGVVEVGAMAAAGALVADFKAWQRHPSHSLRCLGPYLLRRRFLKRVGAAVATPGLGERLILLLDT